MVREEQLPYPAAAHSYRNASRPSPFDTAAAGVLQRVRRPARARRSKKRMRAYRVPPVIHCAHGVQQPAGVHGGVALGPQQRLHLPAEHAEQAASLVRRIVRERDIDGHLR